jgi:hypothetical protein
MQGRTLADNIKCHCDTLTNYREQTSPAQSLNQGSIFLNRVFERATTATYVTPQSKVDHVAFFFTLKITQRTDRLVINGDTQMLTRDVVQCYADVCK